MAEKIPGKPAVGKPSSETAAPLAKTPPGKIVSAPVVPPKPVQAKPVQAKPVQAKPIQAKPVLPSPVLPKPELAKTPAAVKPPVAAKPVPVSAPVADAPLPIPPVVPPVAVAAPVIETPIKIASPVTAPLISEGEEQVTETFTKIEDGAKNFAAEATTKVKAAMEKGSKGVAELVEFSKGNVEAVVASSKIAAKGAEEIAKYATDYGRTSIEKANETAKLLGAVKSPTEFFQLQSNLAKTSLEAFVGEASKFGENYMKLLGEIAQPIQSRYALAVEKVKTAVAV